MTQVVVLVVGFAANAQPTETRPPTTMTTFNHPAVVLVIARMTKSRSAQHEPTRAMSSRRSMKEQIDHRLEILDPKFCAHWWK